MCAFPGPPKARVLFIAPKAQKKAVLLARKKEIGLLGGPGSWVFSRVVGSLGVYPATSVIQENLPLNMGG